MAERVRRAISRPDAISYQAAVSIAMSLKNPLGFDVLHGLPHKYVVSYR